MALSEELIDTIVSVSEGNPGALSVITQLLPLPAGVQIVNYLDREGPKGSNLWVLYKDENGEDIILTAMALIERMSDEDLGIAPGEPVKVV